jgi:polyvinyl alcohol dehydrogenase (cytochrome)
MKSNTVLWSGSAALALLLGGRVLAAELPPEVSLYQANCAACHDAGVPRAPNREALMSMAPEQILAAMESGPMISMGLTMSAEERRHLSEFLAGRALGSVLEMDPPASAMCKPGGAAFAVTGPRWDGWGVDLNNTRFQIAAGAGLTAADVPRLKVKWVLGLPGDNRAYAPPAVVGGRVFVGSQAGKVYSLDAATGCVHWYFDAKAGVRAAITVTQLGTGAAARPVLIVADQRAVVRAMDPTTGAVLWETQVEDFPTARVTGSPAVHDGRIYVPVASGEEGAGASPTYQCCRFRGSVVALEAATGKQLWKTYTVREPQPTKKNAVGTQLWGPSGAPVWSSPVVDPKRNAVYVATGNNYTDPTSEWSDAFLALDLDTGKILWAQQMTTSDAYTAACRMTDRTNCAEADGPDFDFGASPILVELGGGRRALIDGQKSGVVHAVDPDDKGAILWQTRVGKGGSMGGVQWGSATDGENVYVAISDLHRVQVPNTWATDADPEVGGGMVALRLRDGKRVWHTSPAACGDRPRCSPAQPGAVTAIPGVAFAGSMDGHVRAYAAKSGKVVWDFDTVRAYETVNGVAGQGGALDGPGPVVAGGLVLVNSGYAHGGGLPGNVLIAFSVDGK